MYSTVFWALNSNPFTVNHPKTSQPLNLFLGHLKKYIKQTNNFSPSPPFLKGPSLIPIQHSTKPTQHEDVNFSVSHHLFSQKFDASNLKGFATIQGHRSGRLCRIQGWYLITLRCPDAPPKMVIFFGGIFFHPKRNKTPYKKPRRAPWDFSEDFFTYYKIDTPYKKTRHSWRLDILPIPMEHVGELLFFCFSEKGFRVELSGWAGHYVWRDVGASLLCLMYYIYIIVCYIYIYYVLYIIYLEPK